MINTTRHNLNISCSSQCLFNTEMDLKSAQQTYLKVKHVLINKYLNLKNRLKLKLKTERTAKIINKMNQ